MRFAGHTILITGASLGVGLATVKKFYEEGAHVALLARRKGPLRDAIRGLDPSRVLLLPTDVSDLQGLRDSVSKTIDRFGGIDGLVNNAGAHFRGPLATREADEIATMVDVNLRAPLVLSRLVLPELRSRGGFIVNVASLAGKVPLGGAATYSSTKFGLRAFTYALAEEVRGSGIKVAVVSPGPIETGFIMENLDEVDDIVFSMTLCTAEDVAKMIFDCAVDGKVERQFPVGRGRLATLGYLVPGLRRALLPMLRARGKRAKQVWKRRQESSGQEG